MQMRKLDDGDVVHYVALQGDAYLEKEWPEHTDEMDVIWRIFLDRADAETYSHVIGHYEDRELETTIESCNFGFVITAAEKNGPRLSARKEVILRVDLSEMKADEHPKTCSVVYRYGTPNYLN
jgi:hypothetical protein